MAYAVSLKLMANLWMGSLILSSVVYPFLTSKNLTLPSIDDAQISQSLQMILETESLKFLMV